MQIDISVTSSCGFHSNLADYFDACVFVTRELGGAHLMK